VYLDSNGQRKEVEEDSTLKVEIINNLPNETLIRIVLEKPEVWQIQDKHFKDQHHTLSYRLNPIANHYFQRDPMITTDKGAVVGRMTNEVRKKENDLAEIILDLIGAKPIYIVQEPGNLEGGDYIPAEEFALLGEGLRTNMHAINQLLENNVFDFPEIAIVHDPYKQQDEMHLDTYFEFIGEKKAFIVEDRITTKENKPNPSKVPFVTLYKQNQDKSYSQYTENGELSFQSYLESKNIELVPLPKEMQLNYGNNILTISPNKIIAVKNVAETYPSLLSQNNVLFTEVDLENISKGYGGPHCMTQVLRREKN
jgi:arginine deiminase